MIKKTATSCIVVCMVMSTMFTHAMDNNQEQKTEKPFSHKFLMVTFASWGIGQAISGVVNYFLHKNDKRKDDEEKVSLLKKEEATIFDEKLLHNYMKKTFSSIDASKGEEENFVPDFEKLEYVKNLNAYVKLENLHEYAKKSDIQTTCQEIIKQDHDNKKEPDLKNYVTHEQLKNDINEIIKNYLNTELKEHETIKSVYSALEVQEEQIKNLKNNKHDKKKSIEIKEDHFDLNLNKSVQFDKFDLKNNN